MLVFRRQAIYSVSRLAPAMSKVKCTPDGALDMATRRIAFQSACPANGERLNIQPDPALFARIIVFTDPGLGASARLAGRLSIC